MCNHFDYYFKSHDIVSYRDVFGSDMQYYFLVVLNISYMVYMYSTAQTQVNSRVRVHFVSHACSFRVARVCEYAHARARMRARSSTNTRVNPPKLQDKLVGGVLNI